MLDIIIILNAIRGLRRGYRRPLPRNTVREAGHALIHCPRCNSPQSATIETHERWTQLVGTHKRATLTVYRCDHCQSEYNADLCHDNGTGALAISPWTCPLCQHTNSPAATACESCGACSPGTGDLELPQ